MKLNKTSVFQVVTVYAFILLAIGMGYGQARPTTQSITVYQNPT